MHPDQVAQLIRSAMPGAEVRVESPDQTHFEAQVVSEAFTGLRSIARHQLVYQALGTLVGRELHALSIQALTPAERAARKLQAGS